VSKRRGHFCWSCGRTRPNERFSGKGHARHICKDCQKLGAEELAYRQAVRNIDRMIQWETGRVKRKQRESFARFLRHPNERIRQYAGSVAAGEGEPHVESVEKDEDDLSWMVTNEPWEDPPEVEAS
jgi:hypothetical protein